MRPGFSEQGGKHDVALVYQEGAQVTIRETDAPVPDQTNQSGLFRKTDCNANRRASHGSTLCGFERY
jgi:hypothetical protein